MFADILLPLPLFSTYTYSVPVEMEGLLHVGSRVLVQFGKKKHYTGIVTATHSNQPVGYEVKPVLEVLDSKPIVRYPQLKLWNWIAEYYLCSPGEVYKAAVPTGLKPESETVISLDEDFEAPEGIKLTDKQSAVVALLHAKKKLKISEIEASTKIKNCARVVNNLIEMGIANISERVNERYRPKKVSFIELTAPKGDQNGLRRCFDAVGRAPQQEKALITWLDMSDWMKQYAPLKDVTRDEFLAASGVSPAVLRAMIDKGVFRQEKRVVSRFTPSLSTEAPVLPTLSSAQNAALAQIKESFPKTPITLLHGVTGSGKTEIYSHLINSVLQAGNQVLFLVPEISLTTQLTDRLRRIFGDVLLIYHSKFSDTERVEVWKRVLESNGPLIVLGVRSSVFLPFAHLGLVIVDEEHEASFKQYDPAPRYNARDAATVLASMHGCPTLLGSATPSVETYYKATTGKYSLVTLSERFNGATLPDVEVVDMREQRKKKLAKGIFSQPLRLATKETVEDGGQGIIFQNRRGFAPVVVCQQCGWTPKCHNCDVSLIYHKNTGLLRCHYCGFCQPLPKMCPACGQNSIQVFGYGTERIAEEFQTEFPNLRISRMDLDTTRNKDDHQEIIEEFASQKTDILVGTQMVTKGLDFEKVRMVGVINADTLLNFPDFRSNERAFNMLEQVSGRAGRRQEAGKVIIQTTKPDDPVLQFVTRHDYQGFFNSEIQERHRYAYPPFTKVINIYIKHRDAMSADMGAVILAKALRNHFGDRVLGPEKPFVSRVATWYIQSIMLKIEAGASMKKVKALLRSIEASVAEHPQIKTSIIYYDVDPV